ncbi:mitochondrial distribution and morphology protein family 31/32 [Peniophora sp. CONT]|nr:mitochondrial distribution and morphology protein family 31/32 [Peniophora sp. CONT]
MALRIITSSASHRWIHTTRPRHDEKENKPSTSEAPKPPPPPNWDNYPRLFRRLAASLPHVPRPQLHDYLNASSGFLTRMRIRIRWMFIRAFRRFNADDISAFVTWFLMSWGAWVLIGTTTFASAVFALARSLSLQEYVAHALSDYLTEQTGVTIIFESAIVPKWKDQRISFKNVFVSRRSNPSVAQVKHQIHHALNYDVHNHPANHLLEEDEQGEDPLSDIDAEENNWMTIDLNIDSVDVTLSLWRWLDGKGLIDSAVVKGVRGILDRRHIVWDPSLVPEDFRRPGQPGSLNLESLQLEDVLFTVYQPGGFRPYTVSIFRADIGTLRQRWLFHDILRAETIVGQFDNCLFSLHRPQSIGRTNERDQRDGAQTWVSRLRIDGVNIDHVQAMTGDEGPISWITAGKLDAVLDLRFPRDPEADEEGLDTLLLDALNTVTERIPGQRALARPPLFAPSDEADEYEEVRQEEVARAEGREKAPKDPKVVIDIDLRFRDIKAAMPLWSNDLGYSGNALVRPIVAFMNANRTLIPIHCRVVKPLGHFDGAWSMWETGLMTDVSNKVYDALAYHVTSANFNHRLRTVGVWSLQKTAGAVLSALRQVVDPVAVQLREVYGNIEEMPMSVNPTIV